MDESDPSNSGEQSRDPFEEEKRAARRGLGLGARALSKMRQVDARVRPFITLGLKAMGGTEPTPGVQQYDAAMKYASLASGSDGKFHDWRNDQPPAVAPLTESEKAQLAEEAARREKEKGLTIDVIQAIARGDHVGEPAARGSRETPTVSLEKGRKVDLEKKPPVPERDAREDDEERRRRLRKQAEAKGLERGRSPGDKLGPGGL